MQRDRERKRETERDRERERKRVKERERGMTAMRNEVVYKHVKRRDRGGVPMTHTERGSRRERDTHTDRHIPSKSSDLHKTPEPGALPKTEKKNEKKPGGGKRKKTTSEFPGQTLHQDWSL